MKLINDSLRFLDFRIRGLSAKTKRFMVLAIFLTGSAFIFLGAYQNIKHKQEISQLKQEHSELKQKVVSLFILRKTPPVPPQIKENELYGPTPVSFRIEQPTSEDSLVMPISPTPTN